MYDPNKLKTLTYTPDHSGKGGTKLGWNQFGSTPINDTIDAVGVHVWQGSWRKDFAQGTIPLGTGQSYVAYSDGTGYGLGAAIFPFCRYDKADPTKPAILEVLGVVRRLTGSVPFSTFLSGVYNFSNTTNSTGSAPANRMVKDLVGGAVTARFATIKDRVLIADGASEGLWYLGGYAAIGAINQYMLGIGQPGKPLNEPSYASNTNTAYWSQQGSVFIANPDQYSFLGTMADGTAYSLTYPGYTVMATRTTKVTGATSKGVTVWTLLGQLTGPFKVSTTSGNPPRCVWMVGDKVAVYPRPSADITRVVGANLKIPEDGSFCNATILFAENSTKSDRDDNVADITLYTIDRNCVQEVHDDTMSNRIIPEWSAYGGDTCTLTGVSVELQSAVPDAIPGPAWPLTSLPQYVSISSGQLTWDGAVGPAYAYAWFDPLTGHVSNISPIVHPNKVGVNKNLEFSVAEGDIQYPSVYERRRFTHFLFFRSTLAGGVNLYVIGGIDPNDSSTWKGLTTNPTTNAALGNIWVDSNKDTALLATGAFRAPIYTNAKPMYTNAGVSTVVYPREAVYWDGRLWIVPTQDPAVLYFSGDVGQVPLGRPEESFPPTNRLHMPAEDGRVTGMKLLGERVIITTERWAYTIVGNNETNYRLMRVSTRMPGVHTYAMDEMIAEVESQNSAIAFLGTDHRVYVMPFGGEPVWVSQDIQPLIDAGLHNPVAFTDRYCYEAARVHASCIQGRRLLFVSVIGVTSTTPYTKYETFVYDFDNKVWTQYPMLDGAGAITPALGFATAYGSEPSPAELLCRKGSSSTYTDVVTWQDSTANGRSAPQAYISTFPSGFEDQKVRKQLQFIRLYVDEASSGTWTASVQVDYDTSYSATFGAESDDANKWIKGTGTLKELVIHAPAFNANGAPLQGFNFKVTVNFPTGTNKEILHAIDVGYMPISEQVVG